MCPRFWFLDFLVNIESRPWSFVLGRLSILALIIVSRSRYNFANDQRLAINDALTTSLRSCRPSSSISRQRTERLCFCTGPADAATAFPPLLVPPADGRFQSAKFSSAWDRRQPPRRWATDIRWDVNIPG